VLAYLTYVIPAIMLLQGVEVLLTFLLNAYRPRRPGEIPRPAFDSRVLGLLTSPKSLAKALSDAINYQFGFEVSRSWFYQLLGKAITPLVLFALIVLFLISSIVMVQPHQKAIALRMGSIVRDGAGEPLILEPGPHLVLPWPFGSAEVYDVGRVLQVSVGSAQQGIDPKAAILWTTPHAAGGPGAKEEYMVTAPTALPDDRAGIEAEDTGRTPGSALIGLQLVVQYRIRQDKPGFIEYVRQSENPGRVLSRLAERSLSHYLVTQDTDTLLGQGRIAAGEILKKEIQTAADQHKLGLEVVYVAMAGVHPPSDSDVAKAFHQQIAVTQEVQGLIEDARREEIQTLTTVAGSPAQAQAISSAISRLTAARDQLSALERDPSAATPAQLEERRQGLRKLEAEVEDQLARASGRAATVIFEARSARWKRTLTDQARAQSFLAELAAYQNAPSYYRAKRYLDVLAEGLGGNTRKIVIATEQAEKPLYVVDLTDPGTALDLFKDNQ
jgi:regulator of protease activity HflC (stomatin/prohibitin superfamily)